MRGNVGQTTSLVKRGVRSALAYRCAFQRQPSIMV
jgi:hypothetical protein